MNASSPPAPASLLVTGGAGFVGSTLALACKTRWPQCRVTAMDNLHRQGSELNIPRLRDHGCRFHQGDIRDPAQFPPGPFEFLLECSAEPSVLAGLDGSPDYVMQTNLLGTYHCLEKARAWNSKVVFFSTSRVYPIAPLEAHPWRETATRFEWLDLDPPSPAIGARGVAETFLEQPAAPRSLYGWTKYASELLIQEYRAAFGLPALINRCGVIAGPWQFGKIDQGVVALWVMAHRANKPLSYIGYGGTGKQLRDILHVSDLADLVLEQIADFTSWEGWCGNVAGGLPVSASLLELTDLCREITGHALSITPVPETRPADLRVFVANCGRLHTRTPWRPRRSVRDIITDIHHWLESSPLSP